MDAVSSNTGPLTRQMPDSNSVAMMVRPSVLSIYGGVSERSLWRAGARTMAPEPFAPPIHRLQPAQIKAGVPNPATKPNASRLAGMSLTCSKCSVTWANKTTISIPSTLHPSYSLSRTSTTTPSPTVNQGGPGCWRQRACLADRVISERQNPPPSKTTQPAILGLRLAGHPSAIWPVLVATISYFGMQSDSEPIR